KQRLRHFKPDETAVTVGGVPAARYLENIESKFRLNVSGGVVLIADVVAVTFPQLLVEEGNRPVDPHRMAVVVGGIMGQRTEGESVFVDILRFAQESHN